MTVQNGDEKRGIEDYKRWRDSKKRNEKLMNGGGTRSRDGTGGNWEPWRLEPGTTDSHVTTQHFPDSDKEHSLWPATIQNFWSHPLSPILLAAISSCIYRPIPVAFYYQDLHYAAFILFSYSELQLLPFVSCKYHEKSVRLGRNILIKNNKGLNKWD